MARECCPRGAERPSARAAGLRGSPWEPGGNCELFSSFLDVVRALSAPIHCPAQVLSIAPAESDAIDSSLTRRTRSYAAQDRLGDYIHYF